MTATGPLAGTEEITERGIVRKAARRLMPLSRRSARSRSAS